MKEGLPKNVRQIGNVSAEPKIYVEDYVDTFLNWLKSKKGEKPIGALLMGESFRHEDCDVLFISGALEIGELDFEEGTPTVADRVAGASGEEALRIFPKLDVLGWCMICNGFPMNVENDTRNIQDQVFPRSNSLFLWKDTESGDETFFVKKYGDLMQMGGYFIYYEKNPDMQNYMIQTRKQNGVTPFEMVEDRVTKNFRNAIRENMEYRNQRYSSRALYLTSIILVIAVLAIGVSTMNNIERMEAVQKSIETMAQKKTEQPEVSDNGTKKESSKDIEKPEAKIETGKTDEDEVSAALTAEALTRGENPEVEEYYIVKSGDTLDHISIEIYGDRGHVEDICSLNHLSNGNLIFVGQKLLLP